MTDAVQTQSLENALNTTAYAVPLPFDSVGDAGKSKALQTVLSAKNLKAEGKLRKALPILKRAVRKIHDGEYRDAAKLGLAALDFDENLALANHITAIALDKLGAAALALDLYERALKIDPSDPEVYQNLGLLAWRMELYDVAEQFFRIFSRMCPDMVEGPNNLACVLRDKGLFGDAIEVLRAAIYTNQESSLLWNSLGTVMMEQTEFENAILFYKQALEIDPELARAYHNIGYCKATQGEHETALEYLDKGLALGTFPENERAESEHARSSSLIGLGRLDEAWEAYECRNNPRYSGATCFSIPLKRWDGEPLEGKKILIVGEQGLGDEVMFMNVGHDLIDLLGPEGHLTIGVVPRLEPLFKRSFPTATITKHSTIRSNGMPMRGCPLIKDWETYDYWAPMASVLRVLRTDIKDFDKEGGFLTPDPERVAHWRSELDKLGSGMKVGLLWKSMLMSAKRSKYYSPFSQWKDTLRTEGVIWVNLQYGDCSEDLERAEKEFGVKIHQMDGIDLKDNLDDLAALCVAMDLVVGPMNATTNIAAGSGANTAIIGAPNAWPYLGTGQLPWYPTAKVFSPETISDWKPAMTKFQSWLETEASGDKSGKVSGAA
tara:strand:- start:16227 stop:18044 length:1818 start_codon:yes stop_codon:yes gene_type:complete